MKKNKSSAVFLRAVSFIGLFLLAASAALPAAPVAGPNVSMVMGTHFPEGDPFATKQNEPSLGISSRNPQHLLAASNDYRTVQLTLAEGEDGGDAWISLYKSINGGTTWRAMLLAGCPLPIPQCTGGNAALHGLQFSADPTVRAGPYGTFFVAFIAGIRGTGVGSVTAVQRYFDKNDNIKQGDDPFAPDVLNIIDTGTVGQSKDKPWTAVDVPGRSWLAGQTCDLRPYYGSAPVPAFNVYVSYTNFVGQSTSNPHPQIYVARSPDCGKTFDKLNKVSNSVDINVGSSVAVDPTTGTVYVVWRRFGSASAGIPDSIYLSYSTDGGKQFTSPILVSNITPIDQPTTAGTFRADDLPTIAVSVDANGVSRVHVAWAERNNPIDPTTSACLAPAGGNCDARITLVTSTNGGNTFPNRIKVDDWASDLINPANPGRGNQLQPSLTFAAGKLAISWVDQRYDHTVGELVCTRPTTSGGCVYPSSYDEHRVPVGDLADCPGGANVDPTKCAADINKVFTPFVDDTGLKRRHTLDTFAATADVKTDGSLSFTSGRVSQYRYGQVDAATGKNCTALSAACAIRQLRFNVPNLPLYVNGSKPFLGDYTDMAARTIVPAGGTYKFNTGANGAFTTGGFKAIFQPAWTDNQDVVPPRPKADGTVDWTNYQPLFNLDVTTGAVTPNALACTNGVNNGQSGNRDQNVFTTVVGDNWTAFANATAKNLTLNGSLPRGFVITIRNLDLQATGRYRLTFAAVAPNTQASFPYPGTQANPPFIDVDVKPRSSSTRSVWVTSTTPSASVTVQVQKTGTVVNGSLVPGPAGDTTLVVLNPDPNEVPLTSADGQSDTANNNLWYTNSGPGVSNLTNAELANNELANNELANVELANIQLVNAELANAELANVELANVELANNELANAELANAELANAELANAELANAELANVELANAELANAELANAELANNELANNPLVESTVVLKNEGNTDTTLAVTPLLRSGLPATAHVQLVLRKIAVTPVVGTSCVPELVERNAQVANIPDPGTFTPTTIKTGFPDVTVAGSATLPLSPGELAQVTLRVLGTGFNPAQALEFGAWGTKFVVADASNSTVTRVPLIISTFAARAVAGVTTPLTLLATGGFGTRTWTDAKAAVGGSLPGGVTLGLDGTLTVTPSATPGAYPVYVQVTDTGDPTKNVSPQTDVQKINLDVVAFSFDQPSVTDIVVGVPVMLATSTTPPETVTYASQTPNLCSITMPNVGQYLLTGLAVGTCTIAVTVNGVTTLDTVQVTRTFTVRNGTTTTLSSSANPSVFGQPITLTATVASPGTGTPTGSVTFMLDGTTTLGTGPVAVSGGVATLQLATPLSVGTHSVAASYSGDASFESSNTTLSQQVNQAGTTTALTSPANPSVFGQSVMLTASVTVVSPGAGAPTGMVTFMDGATTLAANVTLAGGTASVTTAALAAGAHNITASYSGDTSFAASNGALIQTVNKAATTTALTSSANSSVFGQSVTLTASVAVASPGAGKPSGTVTFMDGATTLAANVTLVSGTASFTTAALGAGAHNITVSYSGDASFQSSTSGALTQTVNPAGTATSLSSSANPSVFGQQVTLTAAVTVNSPGAGTPTGMVTFNDGGSPLGTGTLDGSGKATFTTTTLGVGGHSLTAVYAGSASFQTSTSSVLAQTVKQASTSTVLSASPNPSSVGTIVTLTATVSVTAPAAGTPTGSVTFKDGTAVLATVPVSGGGAALMTSALSVGSHSLTAVYSGDGNDATSTSAAISVTVNPLTTTTTLSADRTAAVFGTTVNLTASVTPATATGQVTFRDGATSLGASTLAAGNATFATSTLTVGAHGLTAAYGGDTNDSGSTSAPVAVTISPMFAATGPMGQPRSYHTATLLNDGTVLVTGGFDATGAPTASSELYNLTAGTFTAVGNLPSKSAGHTATLLTCACANNGKVLAVGGGNSSAETYDPSTRVWSPTGGTGGNRSYHTATVLQNGKVLIVGGSDNSGKPIAGSLIFDPVAGSFTSGPTLNVARERHIAVRLSDGRVLIAGGRAKSGNGYTVLTSAEIADVNAVAFTSAGNMAVGRYSASAALLTDGRALVAGGSSDTTGSSASALNSAELYTPVAGAAGAWASVAATPVMGGMRRDFTLTQLFDGRALAAGGQNNTGPGGASVRLNSAELYTAAPLLAGAFAPTAAPMVSARAGHTATRVQDGRVLLVGGVGTAGVSITAAELFNPGP